MNLLPLDAPCHDESNELFFIFLWSIDDKIFWFFNMSKLITKTQFHYFYMLKNKGVSLSIDHRRMKFSLLDSSWQGASNGIIFTFIALIDEKLFVFYCLQTFWNILRSIDPRDMYLLPLDASCHDESNELCFAFLWSLGGEIIW